MRTRLHAAAAMRRADSYPEWFEAAQAWDTATGADRWRGDSRSRHYHEALIREQLTRLRALRSRGDVEGLVDHLHEALHRSLGDLTAPELYGRSLLGTKHLIEEYLAEVEATIEGLIDADLPGFDDAVKLGIVERAHRNFGRSALLLSGGATLGFYHLGVVKALWHAGVLPEVISGASMGAMVAAGVCSRTDAELDELLGERVPPIERRGLALASPVDMLRSRALLDPDVLLRTIRTNCGDYTFEEAHERSGRTLNISVAPTRTRQKPRVLSHLTAPRVFVATAALASSAVPGLFPPVTLTQRGRDGAEQPYIATERWIDGSFGGDLPMVRIGRLHNVNHFVVSQVNPHVLPFLPENQRGLRGLAVRIATRPVRRRVVPVLQTTRKVAAITPWKGSLDLLLSLAEQEYSGDINVHPAFDPLWYPKLVSNPSESDLAHFVLEGERGVWPKLAMIRDHTRIARCLGRCEATLRARLAGA